MQNKLINKIVGVSCGVNGDNVEIRRFYGEKLGEVGLGWLGLAPQEEWVAGELAGALGGLVLSGGGDIDPALWGEEARAGYAFERERDRWELALLREFIERGKPVLGICRGMQLINVGLGGSIWQDLGERAGDFKEVQHRQAGAPEDLGHTVMTQGWLRELVSPGVGESEEIWVNSLHHQGVRRLGQGLAAGALAADGLVEAVYWPPEEGRWLLGVQWHPERLGDRAGRCIWREYARAVTKIGAGACLGGINSGIM